MATYVCRVGLPDGAVTVRTIEASDEEAVRAEVARLNARLFSVKVAGGAAKPLVSGARSLAGRRSVKPAEFLVDRRQQLVDRSRFILLNRV